MRLQVSYDLVEYNHISILYLAQVYKRERSEVLVCMKLPYKISSMLRYKSGANNTLGMIA